MATYYARANGNVNATNVWSTTQAGATSDLFPSFTNADTLMANGFTITLNVNTTVLEVRNDTNGGATSGGSFTLSAGVTLTANVIAGASATCVNFNAASPGIAYIIGNSTAGTANLVNGITNNSTGTLNITGTCTGGSNNSHGAYNNSTGTINVIGNVVGGSASNTSGANNASSGTINITGNATGASGPGAINGNIGTMNIIGVATGGPANVGTANNSSGTLTVTRAKGNGFGNGSVGLTSQVGVNASQNGLTRVYEIEYGDLGQSPTSGPVFLFPASSNVALFYRSGTTKKTLVDASSSSGLLPNQSDVRAGTAYNAGTNTGTMSVPTAASVALGVNVDNTTGTAILTSGNIGDIWNYPVSGISVSNSIGERLKNCSTVATMGQQLAAALNNVQ